MLIARTWTPTNLQPIGETSEWLSGFTALVQDSSVKREEISLRARFGFVETADDPGMADLLSNSPGIVDLRKKQLSQIKADPWHEERPDDLLPALHGPYGQRSERFSAFRTSVDSMEKEQLYQSLPKETPRTILKRIGERLDESSLNTASKAGEALLRHLYGGNSMNDNILFTTELPPPPAIYPGLQQRSQKATTHSHFTEGLLGWQSGALDLRPSSTTQRLSEELVCTRMEMVMHRSIQHSSKPYIWQSMRLALMSKKTGYFLDRTFVWHHLVPGMDVCIVSLYAIYEGRQDTKTVPVTFSDLDDAGLTPSQAFEAALVSLDETTKKCLIPWTPDMDAITVTEMSNAPTLYRVQARGGCVVARLMLPCFVHAICGMVGCRAEELVVVPYCDDHVFVTTCNEPFSICALGSVTAAPRKESSTYLSSVPLRINHLPSVDEHVRVEWEAYPVWGLHHGFVGTDEFYQFPVPKSRREARATMARLKSRMAPALVRYDSPGRISQADAAEMAGSIPPLQAALAAHKSQRKKPLWFTACIPTARPMASSTASSTCSGKDSPDSPRSALSEAPCQRLCSAEVCPLTSREPAPSHCEQRKAPCSPPSPAPPVVPAPRPSAAPEIIPLSPVTTPKSRPSSSAECDHESLPSGRERSPASLGWSGRGLRDLFPSVKQLIVTKAAHLKKRAGRVGRPVAFSPRGEEPEIFPDADAVLHTPRLVLDVQQSDANLATAHSHAFPDEESSQGSAEDACPLGVTNLVTKPSGQASEAVLSISAIAIPNPVW